MPHHLAAKEAQCRCRSFDGGRCHFPMREQGASLQVTADQLTGMGLGAHWTPVKVKRALDRLASNEVCRAR